MSITKNLKGRKFGRLTVMYDTNKRDKNGCIYCMCQCDCGNKKEIIKSSLLSGNTKSCGCMIKERLKKDKIHYKHGGTHTKLYNIWWKIIARCYNKNDKAYKNYGGRGIKMCNEWKNNYSAFKQWAEKNGYKEGLSIDRINNNEGYNPENCRWATKSEQANNRRTNIIVIYNDNKYTLKQVSKLLKIDYNKLHWAYTSNQLWKYGIEIEEV